MAKKYIQDSCKTCGKPKLVTVDKLNKDCRQCSGRKNAAKRLQNPHKCLSQNCLNIIYYSAPLCKYHHRLKREGYKIKARLTLRDAIKSRRVIKENCSICFDYKSEAHHPNYAFPLDVIWLCRKHHGDAHNMKFV